ncbi:oligosaccharide flippase family protein [Sulfitobacter sp. S0837]|nr:oligosaccharide flippase family protein [Sulfitobacter maritimus]
MLSYIGSRLLNLVSVILLARYLHPEEMGLIAAAVLAIEMVDMLRDLGFREALIYNRDQSQSSLNTGFILFIALGIAQAVLVLGAAQLAPMVVEDLLIVSLLTWLALIFPINTAGAIQEALLQKSFQFGRLAIAEITSVAVKCAVILLMLELGYGIASFVLAMLISRAVRVVLLWAASDWRPTGPLWAPKAAKFLFAYGRHIVAVSILFVLRRRSDQMAIVAALGDVQLGLYYMAARLPDIAILGICATLTKVIFPSLTAVAEDVPRLGRAYLKTLTASMMIMAPISLGLAAVAPLAVLVLFGEKWTDAVPVLAVLALTGIPITLGWTAGDVLKATGRPSLLSKISIAETGVGLPLVWLVAGVTRDILSVALAVMLVECLAAVLRIWVMRSYWEVRATETLRAIAMPVIAALALAGVVRLLEPHLVQLLGQTTALGTAVLLGSLLYAVLIFIIDPKTVFSVLSLFRKEALTEK